jgi:hypothetical protein
MTIDQLVRSHREIELMMGYQREHFTVGAGYTYVMLAHDMNLLHPAITHGEQQVKNAMSGRIEVPQYWGKVINDLLELAARGMKHPPRPGPFWHPNPMSESERVRAGEVLVNWQHATGRLNKELAAEAEIQENRISRIRHGRCFILPTEIDRIAACFDTDRAGFLKGPDQTPGGA